MNKILLAIGSTALLEPLSHPKPISFDFNKLFYMQAIITIFLLFCSTTYGQIVCAYALPEGVAGNAFVLKSTFSMFPDTGRSTGKAYQGNSYPAAIHYNDSSILVYVPPYFKASKPFKVIFWVHGWFNTIDSSLRKFKLLQQWQNAGINALYVFPEGPKNAPDSYGGKWEKPETLTSLLEELLVLLKGKGYSISQLKGQLSGVVFTGHSGAYRAIAKNLPQAHQVMLFDGLYGELPAYLAFCRQNNHRFLHVYTEDGGTKANTLLFMQYLDNLHIQYLHVDEAKVTKNELKQNSIIFLKSTLEHNEVIAKNKQYQRHLKYGSKLIQ